MIMISFDGSPLPYGQHFSKVNIIHSKLYDITPSSERSCLNRRSTPSAPEKFRICDKRDISFVQNGDF